MVHATKLLMHKEQFLQELSECVAEIESLRALDYEAISFRQWKRRVENLLIHGFGEATLQVEEFRNIVFYDFYADNSAKDVWTVDETYYDPAEEFQKGLNAAKVQLLAISEDVTKHFEDGNKPVVSSKSLSMVNKKVFIVHGHDESLRVKMEATLIKLGFEPIVLRKQPNRLRTIIEKFEDYADVGFAVILLTADDVGCDKNKLDDKKFRARQNVVLEMGYFIAKLGRGRVMAVRDPDIEDPGDIAGVVYTDSSNDSQWQMELVRELKAAGYEVDMNKLFG